MGAPDGPGAGRLPAVPVRRGWGRDHFFLSHGYSVAVDENALPVCHCVVLPDTCVSPELLRINPKCQWPENLEAPSGVQGLRCWTAVVLNIMHPHRNEIALDAKIEMVCDSHHQSPCRSLTHFYEYPSG